MMFDVHVKPNPGFSLQKQQSTVRKLFHKPIGLKLKEKRDEIQHLEQLEGASFVR
jgi:hypothetical protein